MSKESRRKKKDFNAYRKYIQEDIRKLVYNYRDFPFSWKKDESRIADKASVEDVSDTDAEEFMMRFFGLHVQKSKLGKLLKIIIFATIIFYVYNNWNIVQSQFTIIIDSVPFIKDTVNFLMDALNAKALIGIFLLSFFVNLFFISFPDEIYFVTYLLAGHDPLILIPVITAGGLLGLTVDYIIGKFLGRGILKKLMKEKYYKYKFASDKWGGPLLFLGTLVPSPVQWFSVALGSFNYGYIRFIFFCTIGKLSKYTGIFYGMNYYTTTVDPFINQAIKPTLENIRQCLNETNTSVTFLSE
ncbi:hypothetical protein GF323_05375 [Candidatus Woesearchaeota archaeon]|nr:hypothetical protein [Candidatus Woesearchaeota archaeon]